MGATATDTSLVQLPGGEFLMGSEDFYPEERPVHTAHVGGFWIDAHPVTVAEFRRFVKETGHVTVAERPLDPADYPDADPEVLVPGSLMFRKTRGPVDLRDVRSWWAYVPGANWRRPAGPGSSISGRRQFAPGTYAHQARWSLRSTGSGGRWNTSEPGTSSAGSASG